MRLHTYVAWLSLFCQWVIGGCDVPNDPLAMEARKAIKGMAALETPEFQFLLSRTPGSAELALGRALFNDPILSRNNDSSCATCHLSNHGFADGNSLAIGSVGQGGPSGETVGRSFGQGVLSTTRNLGHDGFGNEAIRPIFRNSLSTLNVLFRVNKENDSGLFHDGRFGSLRFQVLLPIHTPEELCGTNPVPLTAEKDNIFRAGGPIFLNPVKVTHSHSWDKVSGKNRGAINYRHEVIKEIPVKRPNGTLSVPSRNECTALMVAKVRLVPAYRRLFKMVYNTDIIEDKHISRVLETFVLTHIANRTPYDQFARGDDYALSEKQLRGLMIFHKRAGERFQFGGKDHTGAGCANCHKPPLFGGSDFAALGVMSDVRSVLSRPQLGGESQSGFVKATVSEKSSPPQCHSDKIRSNKIYGPDIGRAAGSFHRDDCYKFRISSLRNVIETFPYFHHGTAKAQGKYHDNFKAQALSALEIAIRYHLRGPVDTRFADRRQVGKVFFDEYRQRDPLIPYYVLDFTGENPRRNEIFPLELREDEIQALLDFVANGLWDQSAVKVGALGNDVSHPRSVPSGFHPSITRDHGNQGELPPAALE